MEIDAWIEQRTQREPEFHRRWRLWRSSVRLSRNMVRRRIELGITQEELARRLKTSQSRVAAYESGTANPTLRTIAKIAAALRMEEAELLRPTEPAEHGGACPPES